MTFNDIALHAPELFLPGQGTDLTKWSVVACDQYTSQRQYWDMVKKNVGNSPSTLNLILPEVYLEDHDLADRIKNINQHMNKYLQDKVLAAQKPGFVLVDRKTSHAPSRKGLIVALDLEHYDFSESSQSLIRATEGTVIDRLPPRIKVRQNAALELPHIMVLIDDPERTVIEPLFKKGLKKIYDFELMMNSGHVKGYMVDDEVTINEVAANLRRLADKDAFKKKYMISNKNVLLYAMGDGNHSLATAKKIWENNKNEASDKAAIMNHPSRYSIVELVNIHDEGLEFEPIYRILFNADIKHILDTMKSYYEKQGSTFSYKTVATLKELHKEQRPQDGKHFIPFISQNMLGIITIKNPQYHLEVATLQHFLDDYLKNNKNIKIDYIHGADIVTELGSKPDNVGFYLPVISKYEFFKTIILDGTLPRKTFSMGSADEKRFYLECRKIL